MIAFILGNWQRFAVWGAVGAAVLAAAWFHGYTRGELKLYDYKITEATQALSIVVKRGEVTERVVTRYVKVAGATRTITNIVEKEVVRYVERNPGSCLDPQWGRLHDAAALNRIPDAQSVADGAAGAPTAAAAIETVSSNYAACNRNADRLESLQAWVKDQEAVK